MIDPSYSVTILHNFYFKAVSAFLVTGAGWYVTDRIVEPRLMRRNPEEARNGNTGVVGAMALSTDERRALRGSRSRDRGCRDC